MLFGSGEMSATGRKIHEEIFKSSGLTAPVKIGILETPTGFEVNAIHGWPERMQKFFEKSLANFKPKVTRIHAWKKDGDKSTNDPAIVDAILRQDYLYCGAGSPGYTIKNLIETRAYRNLVKLHKAGGVLCLGSATAVAMSRFAIPVYEIFKSGEDLHWLAGLDFFGHWGFNLTIVPHWNNKEGKHFDTTRCYMGKSRFEKLKSLLPRETTIFGIDEQTAAGFNFQTKEVRIYGKGKVRVIKNAIVKEFKNGEFFPSGLFLDDNLRSRHRVVSG